MLRGLSTGSKVQVGIIGVGLVAVFGYAVFHDQSSRHVDDDDAYERFARHDDADDDDPFADDGDRFDGPRMSEEALRRRIQEQAEAEERVARRRAAVVALLGARAQPGTAFDVIAWHGATPVAPDEATVAQIRDELAPFDPELSYEDADGSSGTLAVAMASPPTRDEVIAVWGAPDRGDNTWIDPDQDWCATMSALTLTWRRCQRLDDVIGPRSPQAFGFELEPLLGASVADVRAVVGDVAELDGHLRWTIAGLIDSAMPIEITAVLDRKRLVTRLEVLIPATDTDAAFAAIKDRLGGHTTWTGPGRKVVLGEAMQGSLPLTITRAR